MPLSKQSRFLKPLRGFAASTTQKTAQFVSVEPEEQLRAPLENLISGCGPVITKSVVCCEEVALPDTIDSPDFAIYLDGLPAGHVDFKAPGKRANSAGGSAAIEMAKLVITVVLVKLSDDHCLT